MYTSLSSGTVAATRARPQSRRSRLDLVSTPSAVRSARRWTADQLAGADPPASTSLIDNAVLLVSELVTNAIRAACGLSLVIIVLEETVRIEVCDSSRAPLPPSCHRDPDDESGRGLTVVATLARSWGWRPDACGKVVWCELAR
jgi:anti-sigma regulatory factor (Ser/Thr protein kinase)